MNRATALLVDDDARLGSLLKEYLGQNEIDVTVVGDGERGLRELEARDPVKAQIVLFRYFCGLTMDETAAVLGLAERTLDRHWRYLRAWLLKRLS